MTIKGNSDSVFGASGVLLIEGGRNSSNSGSLANFRVSPFVKKKKKVQDFNESFF